MSNYSHSMFPAIVFEAFPILKELVYVRQFASLVPLSPDTTFHLFSSKTGQFFVLVMTDHADPLRQSKELKQLSDEYAFEFTKLIKPYSNDERLEIKENEEILEDPTISDTDGYYHFYLAETTPMASVSNTL